MNKYAQGLLGSLLAVGIALCLLAVAGCGGKGSADAVTVAESWAKNVASFDFGQACELEGDWLRVGTVEECASNYLLFIFMVGPFPFETDPSGSIRQADGDVVVFFPMIGAPETSLAVVVRPEEQPDGAVKNRVVNFTQVQR